MAFTARLFNTLFRRRASRDRIAEEMAFHLGEAERQALASGLSPEEARLAALRRFGNPDLQRERAIDADFLSSLDHLFRDFRLAFRSLSRRRGLALTAIASLALGIGANSALFSVIDAVLLRPLPLPHPERLVVIEERKNGETSNSNPARMADWESRVPALAAAAGFYGEGLILTGQGEPTRLDTIRTLGHPFAVLGIRPLLGRAFSPEEERGIGAPVALLGEGIWRRRYGADPKILGQALPLGGTLTTIVGVLPDRIGYPEGWDLFLPAPADVQAASRKAGFFQVVARLRPGATPATVQPQLSTVARNLAQQYPDSDAGRSARAVPLQEDQSGEARTPLLFLLAIAGAVLLIACVNVAGLLLARAAERQRESAIRLSLGAGRGGLLRLYLIEAQALALAGGLAGLALAGAGLALLKRLLPAETPRLALAQIDLRVAGFGLLTALLCGLLFGLAPAWQAARHAPVGGLREGGRGGSSAGSLRLRRLLVTVQVTLAVVLLFAVGLLGQSFFRLQNQALGFEPRGVLTVSVNFPWDTDPKRLQDFRTRGLEALSALPGVRSAGVLDRLPLEGGSQSGPIAVEGRELPPELAELEISHRAASPNALATLGVPLLAGRLPRNHGTGDSGGPREALINQALARAYFGAEPGGDAERGALGRRITFDTKPDEGEAPTWFEVVGVVGDVRREAGEAEPGPEVFVLPADTYWPLLRFVLRAEGDPARLAGAARAALHAVSPDLYLDEVAPMEEQIDRAFASARTRLWLLASFALVALLLAAIGLYGVLASDVARRTREIGVRLALGAAASKVLSEQVGQGAKMAGIGLAAGLTLGLVGARILARRLGALFVQPDLFDPGMLAGISLVLLLTAGLASFLPARRASLVEPAEALRHE